MNGAIKLTLSEDEALVLFAWLAELNEAPLAHLRDAEQRVTWSLEAQLEKALTAPLSSDFDAQVERARQRLLAEEST